MARSLRPEAPGGWFHITARAVGNGGLFAHDVDRALFLLRLGRVVLDGGWRCLGYCLMTTHYHLLVNTPEPNLARGMQQLNARYAESFNTRHRRRGHAFGGRYWSEPISRDAHLLEALRYIALNPVRAGIVPRPEAWRWSSHVSVIDPEPFPTWLAIGDALGLFGGGASGRRRYANFVAEGIV